MDLLKEFDDQKPIWVKMDSKLRVLLPEILGTSNVRVHSVTTRVKDRASLEKKILGEELKYVRLEEVTDLCATRIITYFEDDVDKISSLVEQEFTIDARNSVDKRQRDDFDRFGYASVHYVASLKPSRTALAEYSQFAHMKFEIQIRSILQHSWAEIEHDLEYKSELEIPKEIRRRFARLAGLLELADAEFTGIRDQIEGYQDRIELVVKSAPETVLVDRDSLIKLIKHSDLATKLDPEIAEVLNAELRPEINVDVQASEYNVLGLSTIAAVESALAENMGVLIPFARNFLSESEEDRYTISKSKRSVGRGISLAYLGYLLMAQLGSTDEITRRLNEANFPKHVIGGLDGLAQRVLKAYERTQHEQASSA